MATSSPPATPMSQASTKVGHESSVISDKAESFRRRALERVKQASTAQDVLIFLIAFRILNALSVKTFFQPDEFFQSLEPAWDIAFGANTGAWITWEWKNQLRSSLHPYLFAAVYWLCANVSNLLQLPPTWHADLMIIAPKLVQALFAALGDYYTWRLGERVYGAGSFEAWSTLAITVCSPWQWFCSTRTFSNCLETTLTTVALAYWPWEWAVESREEQEDLNEDDSDDDSLRRSIDEDRTEELSRSAVEFWDDVIQAVDEQGKLRRCLIMAALACILRPTNIIIWICFTCFMVFRIITYGKMVQLPWLRTHVWLHVSDLTLSPATKSQRIMLFKEVMMCGSFVLIISLLADRMYFQIWTFPPLRFLHFNIAQALAGFYGMNRWDYYFTEGLPLLLTTYLPFTAIGIYRALFLPERPTEYAAITSPNPSLSQPILNQFATTSLFVPIVLSLISHKEVRFIYPLLPLLHILCAGPITTFFVPAIKSSPHPTARSSPRTFRQLLLALILLLNTAVALLATTSHQPGPLSVLSYLRSQHITYYLSVPPPSSHLPAPPASDSMMTVGFLMPCHSTPWRSHMVFPTIKAWALTCEPPLHITNLAERDFYLDEADQFYADPKAWILSNLGPPPAPPPSKSKYRTFVPNFVLRYFVRDDHPLAIPPTPLTSIETIYDATSEPSLSSADELPTNDTSLIPYDGHDGRKHWPTYLAFFSQLEPVMRNIADPETGRSGYRECWRGWNSWGHDDWRRKGDVVVWCLKGSKGGPQTRKKNKDRNRSFDFWGG